MNVHEFESKETGEIKPVSTNASASTELEQMKLELDQARPSVRDVDYWNWKRDAFKKKYSPAAIGLLDASGYISKWLRPSTIVEPINEEEV